MTEVRFRTKNGDLWKKFRMVAIARDKTICELLEIAIAEFLQKEQGNVVSECKVRNW